MHNDASTPVDHQPKTALYLTICGNVCSTVKHVLSCHSKRPKIVFQDRLSLNAGQKHSALPSTFIKLPFVIKIFVLSIFEWPLKIGFTVCKIIQHEIG